MKKIILILIFLNSYNAMGAFPILRISYDLNLKLSYGIGIFITIEGDPFTEDGFNGPYYMYSKSIFKKRTNHSIGFQGGNGWASGQLGVNFMNIKRSDNLNDTYWGVEYNIHPLFLDLKVGLMGKQPFKRISDLRINTSLGLGI